MRKRISKCNCRLTLPEFNKGRMKKKFRESPMRELIVSELMAQTGSPCMICKES